VYLQSIQGVFFCIADGAGGQQEDSDRVQSIAR